MEDLWIDKDEFKRLQEHPRCNPFDSVVDIIDLLRNNINDKLSQIQKRFDTDDKLVSHLNDEIMHISKRVDNLATAIINLTESVQKNDERISKLEEYAAAHNLFSIPDTDNKNVNKPEDKSKPANSIKSDIDDIEELLSRLVKHSGIDSIRCKGPYLLYTDVYRLLKNHLVSTD